MNAPIASKVLERPPICSGISTSATSGALSSINAYVGEVIAGLCIPSAVEPEPLDEVTLPERVFDVLTARQFCYLSKSRVACYKAGALALISRSVKLGEPIAFFYDLGGGYHASLQPGIRDLDFNVGLGELLVLGQIATFGRCISRLYKGGIRFRIVIDNLCAHLVNDIPVQCTEAYCARFRALIRQAGLSESVDLLVESEYRTVADFERLRQTCVSNTTPQELVAGNQENVERFLGRRCDEIEASARLNAHREIVGISERLLAPLINGVHMSQRATADTLCFRPFPGADSRIQAGEVALTRGGKRYLRPVLLTSANIGRYDCTSYSFPEILSPMIRHVTYADPIDVGGQRSLVHYSGETRRAFD